MEKSLKHENQSFPSSISDQSNLRSDTKSDVVNLLSAYSPGIVTKKYHAGSKVFDGAVLVHLVMSKSKTFGEYVIEKFCK